MLTFSSQNLCEDYGFRREIGYACGPKVLASRQVKHLKYFPEEVI